MSALWVDDVKKQGDGGEKPGLCSIMLLLVVSVLKVGCPVEVEVVEKEVLPFRRKGRSAGGNDGTRDGERMTVGLILGRDVGGRGGRGGGLCGEVGDVGERHLRLDDKS